MTYESEIEDFYPARLAIVHYEKCIAFHEQQLEKVVNLEVRPRWVSYHQGKIDMYAEMVGRLS